MLGHAGFLTGLSDHALNGMIDVVKGLESETGYTAILKVSEVESAMRTNRVRRTKTVCTYCGVGCTLSLHVQDQRIVKVTSPLVWVTAPVGILITAALAVLGLGMVTFLWFGGWLLVGLVFYFAYGFRQPATEADVPSVPTLS